jgi:hypothetical protein
MRPVWREPPTEGPLAECQPRAEVTDGDQSGLMLGYCRTDLPWLTTGDVAEPREAFVDLVMQ